MSMVRGVVRRTARWRAAGLVVGLAVTALLAPVAAGTAAAAPAKDRLEAGEVLRPGESLQSPNGRFVLSQQPDGQLVLRGPDGKGVFNTITSGNPGAVTKVLQDGNVVVAGLDGRALFNTRTNGYPGAYLQVHDDGNLLVKRGDKEALWTRHQWLGTLPSGFTLAANDAVKARNGGCKFVMLGDGNAVVQDRNGKALFQTGTHGNAGASAILQPDGNLVVKAPNGRMLFNTGTAGNPGARLDVQDDCNAVIRMTENGKALWNTRTARS